jgi:hypothetical protein
VDWEVWEGWPLQDPLRTEATWTQDRYILAVCEDSCWEKKDTHLGLVFWGEPTWQHGGQESPGCALLLPGGRGPPETGGPAPALGLLPQPVQCGF